MSMSDSVGDMLTMVRNAQMAKHDSVDVRYSSLNAEIVRILKREGFIMDFAVEGGLKKTIRVYLKYSQDRTSVIKAIRRISKPGLRRYVKADKIPRALGGLGIVILTTPSGVLTDSESRKKKVGGEVLCEVW